MKTVTWILGVLAFVTILATMSVVIPRSYDVLRYFEHRTEYKFLSLTGTGLATPPAEFFRLKAEGWKVDDLNFDSCGGGYIVMRSDP